MSSQPQTGQWLWQPRTNALLLIASLLTLAGIVTQTALAVSTTFEHRLFGLAASSELIFAAFMTVLILAILIEIWLWISMILYVLRNPDFGAMTKTLLVLLQTISAVYGSMLIYFFSYRRRFASLPEDRLT